MSTLSSTLHAFFLAAKEKGDTEFQLRLLANANGKIEFCISPQAQSEMSANFEVRSSTVRAAAAKDVSVQIPDYTYILFGGTRSGEEPVLRFNSAPSAA